MKKHLHSASCGIMLVLIAGSVVSAAVHMGEANEPDICPPENNLYVDVPREIREMVQLESQFTIIAETFEAKEQEASEESQMYPSFTYSRDWSAEDCYLLARIAMAEAEGESTQSKTLVILTVLNRVWSDDFPDNIHDVIFEQNNGVYQFSCIGNGRWDRVEPNADCWEAVDVVQTAEYDYSGGALYFETCEDENNWHSRNLEFLYQCGKTRFYR